MPLYQVYGLKLKSNITFPELSWGDGDSAQCTFQLLPAQQAESAKGHWFHCWHSPDGKVWLSFGRQGSHYLLRFPDLADFRIAAGEEEVCCYRSPGIPLETIRHLFLDQVLPLILSQRGKLVLHASAVAVADGAIAFVGKTGLGKSTLAASFLKAGFPLLTDDCLLLEEREGRLLVQPSYPGLRLWDDVLDALPEPLAGLAPVAHYTDKKRLVLNNRQPRFITGQPLLRSVYFLAASEEAGARLELAITPLHPRVAFMELLSHAYKLDIRDQAMLRKEFDILGRIVALPLFYRLAFPRDLSLLSTVQQAILSHTGRRCAIL
jgi:hypothetical protein